MDQNVEMLLLNKINKQVDIVSGVHRERESGGSSWQQVDFTADVNPGVPQNNDELVKWYSPMKKLRVY